MIRWIFDVQSIFKSLVLLLLVHRLEVSWWFFLIVQHYSRVRVDLLAMSVHMGLQIVLLLGLRVELLEDRQVRELDDQAFKNLVNDLLKRILAVLVHESEDVEALLSYE